MLLILTLSGILFFTIGLWISLILFGIPTSLSETYYNIEVRFPKWGFLFYIYLITTVLLLIIPIIEIAGIWGFLSCVGLAFVGAAPDFRGIDKYIHICGALLAAASSIVILLSIHKIIWILPIFIIMLVFSLLTNTYKDSYVFWLEMWSFYSLFLGLILFLI